MKRRITGVGFLVGVALLLLPAISRAQTTTLTSQYVNWHDATTPGPLDEGSCFVNDTPGDGHVDANGKGGRTCYRWFGGVPSTENTLIVHVAGNVESFEPFAKLMQTVTVENDVTSGGKGFQPRNPCINGDTNQDGFDLTGFTGWMLVQHLGDFDPTFSNDFTRLITSVSETWCCALGNNNVATTSTGHNPGKLSLPLWLVRVRAGSAHEDGLFDQTNVTILGANVTGLNQDFVFGGQTNACGTAPDFALPPGSTL